jgi:small subunit ribosomal protein S7
MPRRARVIKKEIPADAKYHSVTVTRLINKIMLNGKKSTAEQIVYEALQVLEREEAKPPVTVLEQALKNTIPVLEVKPRRVGGATYQVPVEVRPDRGLSLAIRWLVKSSRARTGRSMAERLNSVMLPRDRE